MFVSHFVPKEELLTSIYSVYFECKLQVNFIEISVIFAIAM